MEIISYVCVTIVGTWMNRETITHISECFIEIASFIFQNTSENVGFLRISIISSSMSSGTHFFIQNRTGTGKF